MRWSPPLQNAQPPSFGDGPLPVSSTQPTSVRHPGVVERGVQLVDGVRAEGVADLGPVEGDAHRAVVDGAVVGDVVEVEAGHLAPGCRVEQLGDHGPHCAVSGAATFSP